MTIRRLIAAKNRPDTADEIAARVKWIAAGRQAHADALAKFGAVTPENAQEFISFQERRAKELEAS
jgi:histidinol-phosphate/aromatic aminotransferase/cobyric acid decarboxylase-like protein